jgi:predicted ATPase
MVTNESSLKAIVCSERPVSRVGNIIPGPGIENLTELNITIADAINATQPKRIVIEILSDVLLRHKALQTRKWLTELLERFRSKGITTLAVINPGMHSQADTAATLDIFDGNLEVTETTAENEPMRALSVKWMRGLDAYERVIPLDFGAVSIRKPKLRAPTNLPAPPTPLIGREKELAGASSLLLRKQTRLLTLIGPGGSGKTRLALEVAGGLADEFPSGVFFVALDSVKDTSLVLPTIAATLGVKESGGRPLSDSLKDFLRDKRLLLFLDNFEQVVAAGPAVSELLAACPEIAVLVTSRAPLRVRGEYEFSVPPLALPDLKHLPTPEKLSQYGAVQLFIERALAVKPDFAVSHVNAPAVAEICYRLDGLPLAIELAAARIRLLSPTAILAQLENRMKLLTGGARDLPARQQTLRNAIAWSYDLLNDEEKRLFQRLSVFLGGSSMVAAEAVCNPDKAIDILNSVESLVAKNLLRMNQIDDEPRLVMLETIREYASECLIANTESGEIRRQHANFYLRMAEDAESKFEGPQEAPQLDRLEREHGNIRSAMNWMMEHEEGEEALRLAGSLRRFWLIRGYLTEGQMLLTATLAMPSASKRTKARAHALFAAGAIASIQGHFRVAESLSEESVAIARELQDKVYMADALNAFGQSAYDLHNLAKSSSLFEESLNIARQLGDYRNMGFSLRGLGSIALIRGDVAEALSNFEEYLLIARKSSDKRAERLALEALSTVAIYRADYMTAQSLLAGALKLSRELDDKMSIALSLAGLGKVAWYQGDIATADSLSKESLVILRELGVDWAVPSVVETLGRVAYGKGESEQAESLYSESLELRSGDRESATDSLERLAELALAQGKAERASRLLGAVEALRKAVGYHPAPIDLAEHENITKTAREKLGQAAYESLRSKGAAMTFEQALSYAREEVN